MVARGVLSTQIEGKIYSATTSAVNAVNAVNAIMKHFARYKDMVLLYKPHQT